MAVPNCPHCSSERFELHEADDIDGATHILAVVRCANCGAPVGILEKEHIGELLGDQADQIAALGEAISRIKTQMIALAQSLNDVRRLLLK